MNLRHGIDVASRMDYTALVTLENIDNNYIIRQAKRWRGQNYTQICNEITQYIKGDVIIDATGVGYAVAEMLPEPLTKIWLTGGERVTFDGQLWKVPQVQLISNLVLKIEQEQIKIPSNLSLKDNILHELNVLKQGKKFEAKQGEHDDLVFALALALWGFEQNTNTNSGAIYAPSQQEFLTKVKKSIQ